MRRGNVDPDEDKFLEPLQHVTTVTEVVELYGMKNVRAVQLWCEQGDVTATKIGGVWVISLASVIKKLGRPKTTPNREF